jgi:hypothetical protein
MPSIGWVRLHAVTDDSPEWRRERRNVPAHLLAEAAAYPGGYVYEIDNEIVTNADGYVPAEAIIGAYEVGPDGRPTGEYLHNPQHGPVHDDFSKLTSPDHWLGWLPGDPDVAVREQLEQMFADQVAGSVLAWVKVIDEPGFLTSVARPDPDSDRLFVRRAAMAVPFGLGVSPPGKRLEILSGVFTWVASGLGPGEARRDRVWLDFGMSREQATELLKQRIFEVGDTP